MGRTRGVEGFFVGSTWPSLYTGTNPARHGVHYQLQIVPGTYDLHWCPDAAFVRTPPFWRALSEAGRRVAVLDVPLSRLDRVNGLHVVEWGGHDHFFGFQTQPEALAAEIRDRHGSHPMGVTCDGRRTGVEDWRRFVETLETGVERKARLTRELLMRGEWDAFIQVFTEGHCAGHQAWHLHDPVHPAHDPVLAERLGDPIRRVYVAIDRAIGELLEVAGDTRVVVFAGHDMGCWYGAQFLLPQILSRLGVTVVPAGREGEDREGAVRRALRSVWERIPPGLQAPIREVRERVRARTSGSEPAHGWVPSIAADVTRSACFPLNNGQAVGGIRLNLKGREPAGLLAPGPEAEAFCRQLAADLLAIVDGRSGGPLVKRVLRTRDLYTGPHLDALPDLLVEWNDAEPTGNTAVGGGAGARVRAHSPAIGEVEGVNTYGRTGEHRADGWFIAAGPGIPAGDRSEPASILDLAPTFAALLGVTLEGVDGRPIRSLLGEAGEAEPDERGPLAGGR